MGSNKIKNLLQKYYEGQTTLKEEKLLKNSHINSSEVDKIYFEFLKDQKNDDVIKLNPPKRKIIKHYYFYAACLVILFGIGMIFYINNEHIKAEKYLELYSQTIEKVNTSTHNTDKFVNIFKDISHE